MSDIGEVRTIVVGDDGSAGALKAIEFTAGLAAKLFADRQVTVPETVIRHMIERLARSPEAIRDFVALADARALSEKRPINLGLIRDLLATGPP